MSILNKIHSLINPNYGYFLALKGYSWNRIAIVPKIQTLLWLADADGATGGFVSVSGFLSSVAMVKKLASTVYYPKAEEKINIIRYSLCYWC